MQHGRFWTGLKKSLILCIFNPPLPQGTAKVIIGNRKKQQRCTSLEGPDYRHSAIDRRRSEKALAPDGFELGTS